MSRAGFDVTLVGVKSPEILSGTNIQIVNLPTPENRATRMIGQTYRVYREALKANAQVYHFHDPELLPCGLMLKKFTGAKVVFDSHECFREDVVEKDWIPKILRKSVSYGVGAIEDFVVEKIDLVIAATPHIEKFFSSRANSVVTINNYPIADEFKFPNLQEIDRTGVCYAGALSPARGILPFLDAVALIDRDIPVHIAGTFANDAFEEAVRSHPSWRYITYHGQVDRKVVGQIYASCFAGIVTLLPAPNHVNSQPNKLFEYMSSGLAVIGSNFPIWKSVIEDGEAGLLVDPSSPSQIAAAIQVLHEDRVRAERMGQQGARLVRELYNWNREGERLVEVYDDLLAS
ncbi:glycosyltransferase family 4 protein [Qipengyuania algicida]|uniref:glycosyltransferase family 4 protein n=1 Tax=Qipengyuania algicida TaxID=1836209 RepID=UPI001368654F|nr:glycosyltransferase family 4 protein [Qipengyuania algicida]